MRKKLLFLLGLLLLLIVSVQGQSRFKTVNYLNSITGKYIMSGQHNDQKDGTNENYWTNRVNQLTGKYPALYSGDFLFNGDGPARWAITYEAERQWNAGAAVNLMWHTCPPVQGDVCNWDGGLLSSLNSSQWSQLLTNGSALNNTWKSRIDQISVYLQYLEDKGVEVMWRPLHEQNQTAFWWNSGGAANTKALWKLTHDYMTNTKGLSNLIWVWDVQDMSTNFGDYNPGAAYFDIAALDIYGDGHTNTSYYNALLGQASGKPVANGETFKLPVQSEFNNQPNMSFFMVWAYGLEKDYNNPPQQTNSVAEIQACYANPRVITRDEMPGWGNVTAPTNLATAKPVTVSSTEAGANIASNAVDGSYITRWSSAYSDAQWLTVDLASNYNVNRVKITWEAAYGKDYTVQYSTDGTTWATAKIISGNTSLSNDHTGLTGMARYVRINGTARGTAYGYSIFELEVYGTAAVVNQAPTVSLTSPSNNTNVTAPATLLISANAADSDGSVTKVDFYSGSTLLATDNAAPYTYSWSNVAAGTYTITARGTDNNGAGTTSSAITVVVNNPVTPPSSATKVVAYVANWNDLNTYSNAIDYAKLTHINIAFENPNSNGDLSFNAGDAALIQKAHANNVKVYVSIGGGSASTDPTIQGNYFSLISDARRAGFVSKIAAYLQARNFDGIDVDLEGPAINGDYGKFIADLSAALKPAGKGLTAALSQGYGGGNVPSSTFAYFDFINIMAYDATGPWDTSNPGQHSSYAYAQSNVQYWLGRGLPKNKAVLGLPFYGYGFGSVSGEWSYKNIVSTYAGAENADQAGSTIWYNGIPTIKAKVNYSFDQAIGGVMIWELSQDATGAKSLLLAIDQVVKSRSNVTPVPVNLATGKPVSVSSTEAGVNAAGNAVDGQYATRWSSAYTDAEWLTVDLGAVYAVNRVKITWEAAYGRDYTVQYSTDGTNWTTARAVTGNTSLMNDHTGLTGTARYVRMNGTARGTAFGYSVYELEVYGVIPVPVNLATGKAVTVSSTEAGANVASNAVDGQYGTRWSSLYTDAQWLTVDLGANYDVNRVKITWEAAYGRDYRVVGSLDGVTWTALKTITGNTTLTNDHVGLTGTYRYISMNGTARGTAYGYSIYELEVYGTAAGNTNQLPTVSLTSPANNTSVTAPASIVISANASDSDGSVTKVDFYNGTTLLNSDATVPYSFTWTNIAAGSYTITARATDNVGAVATSFASVVTVTNVVVVNTPPSVTLTSPSANASFNAPATITISANASDADGTVSKVDFYSGSTLLFNDYAAPFTFTWTNVAAGTYTITARATDNSGAGTTSSAITITVVNVVNNTCASIAQYIENAGYAAGSKVKNNGRQYECKPYPYSGWCNGAAWAYGPGSGAYWSDAWLDKGSCTARSAADLVGINDAQVSEVFLSPNPATDVITIHSDLASTVRVFNVQGMEVMTETSVNANGILHVSELAAGIYYIRIDTGNELVTKAIIKK